MSTSEQLVEAHETNHSRLILVDVRAHGNTELKIVWTKEGASFAPYFVDKALIRRVASRVRDSLAGLVRKCMTESCGHAADLLREVASNGNALYRALFTASGGSVAEEVKQWLDELHDPHRISFQVDDRVHVPWGLLFDTKKLPSVPANVVGTDIEHYQSFWCLKYKVSSIYFRITPRGIERVKLASAVPVLSVVNRTAFDSAYLYLNDEEKAFLEGIRHLHPVLSSSDQLIVEWDRLAAHIGIVHFYCHASGTSLALSEEDLLSMDTFRLNVRRSGPMTSEFPCVLFLNGCSTAIGDIEGGFLEASGAGGFSGFIGTETKVPDIFALKFGIALLHSLLTSGKPIYQVLDALRRKHWPLSLVYSLYCHPMIRMSSLTAEPLKDENICFARLGSRLI